VAPMLGALLLTVTDWRGAFYAQAFLGAVVLVVTLLFTETIQERNTGGVIHTLGRLFVVLKNKRFSALLVIFATSGICFLAYVSASSYIYQDFFGLSSLHYSYFFSFNALMIIVGPPLYVFVSTRISRFKLVTASFIITLIAGVLIATVGQLSPWAFAATLLPTTIMGGFIAPPSRFLMLSQQSGDTGSASSLISAVSSITGSLGMMIASLNLGNLVILIGALNILMSLACGGAWLYFTSRPLLKDLKQ
jgi:DHA1 family bicyclomycin/chloramphenicol resistance-like MFS transporter